jgi:hypothetical protein
VTTWTTKTDARDAGFELIVVDEAHIIGEEVSQYVFPIELPSTEVGTVTVKINGVTATQVTGSPLVGQCVVDLSGPLAGTIRFNAADDGQPATVSYKGRGSSLFAKDINKLQSAKVDSVAGVLNRTTVTGTTLVPIVDISSAYVGQASITTLGTITTGVWNGTSIGVLKGGTGQTAYTIGDLLFASSTSALSKLGIGSTSQFLFVSGGVPVWHTLVSADVSDATSSNTINTLVKRDSSGNFSAGTISAALTGNASTATALQNPRTINGVSFDGTSNIIVSAGTVGTLTFGTHLTSGSASFSGSNATITSDATDAGTASTIVARDASKGFTAGKILPDADNTRDLGAVATRYANIYSVNIVVGTINATSGSLSGDFTIHAATGDGIFTIGNASSTSASEIRMLSSSTAKNWLIATNFNGAQLEFTPSTTNGGSTFTTPSLSLTPTTAVFPSTVTVTAKGGFAAGNGASSGGIVQWYKDTTLSWQWYMTSGDTNIYLRDLVNSTMALTVGAGVNPSVTFNGAVSGITTLAGTGAVSGFTTATFSDAISNAGLASGFTMGAVAGQQRIAYASAGSGTFSFLNAGNGNANISLGALAGTGAVSGFTTADFSGIITVTNGQVLQGSGQTTSRQFIDFTNTGGRFQLGVDSSAGGGMFTGSAAYSTSLGTVGATSLHFATNNTVRVTISSAGAWTLAGTSTATTSNSGSHVAFVKNTATDGYSSLQAIDSAGTAQVSMGWGNSTVGITALQNTGFFYVGSANPFKVFTNGTLALTISSAQVTTFAGQYSGVRFAGSITVDWNNGNVQSFQLTNNGQTVTMSNPKDGARYILLVTQPASGAAGTVTWPVNLNWGLVSTPVISTTNGKTDMVGLLYRSDTDQYYGSLAFGF